MKTAFAIISLIIGFAAFVPYYAEMWRGTLKPHIFSWITWTVLTGLGFYLSIADGGGQGAWILGMYSLMCFVVVIFAIFRGEKKITRVDKMAFAAAILTTIIYLLTKNAVVSVILAGVIDSLGFIPTFRKSYNQPNSEPAMTYAIAGASYIFAILALENYTFVTMFYELVLMASNYSFVSFIWWRRQVLGIK